MIELMYHTDIQNYNPADHTCMLMLYGIISKDGKEVGRFVLAKKLLEGSDFENHFNQANQSVDQAYFNGWQESVVNPIRGQLDQLVTDSNKNI